MEAPDRKMDCTGPMADTRVPRERGKVRPHGEYWGGLAVTSPHYRKRRLFPGIPARIPARRFLPCPHRPVLEGLKLKDSSMELRMGPAGKPCATIFHNALNVSVFRHQLCGWLTFPCLPLAVIAFVFYLAVSARSTFCITVFT
jgi:hypothetical protein